MPNICPHCRAELIDESKFCSACGEKVEQQSEAEKTSQPQQQDQNSRSEPAPKIKKSNKKLIIGSLAIIIAVIIILLLIVFYQGGTNPFHSSDSRFIGEWEQNTIGNALLWKFNNDGTLDIESSNAGTWEVQDTQVCINNTVYYTYEFSNNGYTLLMKRAGENNIILTKKIQQGTLLTPKITCATNSTTNRLIITSIDENVKWSDIEITTNPVASWQVQDANKIQLAKINITSTIVKYATMGDNILVLETVGDVAVNLTFKPTNDLLGSWIVNV